MEDRGFVYLLTNKNHNVLYTGVTNDLRRRIQEHKNRQTPGFTQKYNVDHLVYYEAHANIGEAILREKLIKMKSKRGKIRLIESVNPEWRDLFEDL